MDASRLLKYRLLKFSSSISPDTAASNILWHHESGPNIVASIEGCVPGSYGYSPGGKVFKVEQNANVLELLHLEHLCREAQRQSAGLEPSKYAISALARSPCIAIRYHTPNNLYRRIQVRFATFQDWSSVVGILANLHCHITYPPENQQHNDGNSRPSSALEYANYVGAKSLGQGGQLGHVPDIPRPSTHHPPEILRTSSAISWDQTGKGRWRELMPNVSDPLYRGEDSHSASSPQHLSVCSKIAGPGTAHGNVDERREVFRQEVLRSPTRPATADGYSLFSQSQGNAYPTPDPSSSAPTEMLEYLSQTTNSNFHSYHPDSSSLSQVAEVTARAAAAAAPPRRDLPFGDRSSRSYPVNHENSLEKARRPASAVQLSAPTSLPSLENIVQTQSLNSTTETSPCDSRKRSAPVKSKSTTSRKRPAKRGKTVVPPSQDTRIDSIQGSDHVLRVDRLEPNSTMPLSEAQGTEPLASIAPSWQKASSSSKATPVSAIAAQALRNTCPLTAPPPSLVFPTAGKSQNATESAVQAITEEKQGRCNMIDRTRESSPMQEALVAPEASNQVFAAVTGTAMAVTTARVKSRVESAPNAGKAGNAEGADSSVLSTQSLKDTHLKQTMQSLREYVSQPEAERRASLNQMICELIHDDDFLAVCVDVENAWRRIGLGY